MGRKESEKDNMKKFKKMKFNKGKVPFIRGSAKKCLQKMFKGFFMHEHIFFRTLSPRNSKYRTLFKVTFILGIL